MKPVLFSVVIAVTLACLATPTSAQFNRRQVRQNCITPENYYGSCVALSYCPQAAEVFQLTDRRTAENYVFALQRSCGTRSINRDPLVCCTRPVYNPVTERPSNPFFPPTEDSFVAPRPVTTQPPDRFNPFLQTSTERPRPIQTTTTAAPVTSAPLVEPRGPSCRIPPGKVGVCVDIKQCQPIISELLVRKTDPEFQKYVRASNLICNGVGQNVCCPTGETVTTPGPPTFVNSDEVPRSLPTVADGCGYTSVANKKIVGGVVSKKGAWPWIALLGYDDASSNPFKCGGTLITARHVITAAHCVITKRMRPTVTETNLPLTFVRLGEHDLTTNDETMHVDVQVAKTVAHPDYNYTNGRTDIAMVYLERNVKFNPLISPICMPNSPQLRSKSYVDTNPFVAGWGKTQEGGETSNVLQELMVPVLKNEVCQRSYEAIRLYFGDNQFDRAVICAGVLAGGKDTCQGDSGGPLMTFDDGGVKRFYLIGIVSYGRGCARANTPGVYTSTQYFMDWILEQLQNTP